MFWLGVDAVLSQMLQGQIHRHFSLPLTQQASLKHRQAALEQQAVDHSTLQLELFTEDRFIAGLGFLATVHAGTRFPETLSFKYTRRLASVHVGLLGHAIGTMF